MSTPLSEADDALIATLDRTLREGAERAGDWLACRLGCDECCIGPFPINALDARRLRRGLAAVTASDPRRGGAIRGRAGRAIEALRPSFPGDAATGILANDDEAEARFAAAFADVPCPALDPGSRACDLYEWRPVSCRTFGPPVRIGGEDLAPCRLCFAGVEPGEVDRCRVDVDPEGREDDLLDGLEPNRAGRETLVAFALASEDNR